MSLLMRHWGIKARLMCTAVLPVTLMFFSIVFYFYFSLTAEVHSELEERGKLISYSLAESSQYGVTSGNLSYLENTIHGLLNKDHGISRIQILDSKNTIIFNIQGTEDRSNKKRIFEQPIKKELIDIDAFNESGKPHVSDFVDAVSAPKTSTVGYVRIEMSPAFILVKQQHKILVGASIAGIILLVSAILGLCLSLSVTKPLAYTISVLRQIRRGNYRIKLNVTATGEIGDLQSTIIEMATSLDQSRQDLEGRVQARTSELEIARDAAVKSNQENRKLIQKINSIVEEERKNIAIELHDHLNASLIVVRLESQGILEVTKKMPESPHRQEIQTKASAIVNHSKDLYAQSRDLVRRLRPEVIDMLGLRNAVEEIVSQYNAIQPDCRFHFEASGDFSRLGGDLPITAYRLVQEGLSNVVKHASASACHVNMLCSTESGLLHITVSDNGRGFDSTATGLGIGLIGIRERVYGAHGYLKITSQANSGTIIEIELPIVT